MFEFILDRGNYWLIIALMMTGLYIVFAAQNLIKRLVGLSIFQTSVFLFYITLGKVVGGSAPILYGDDVGKHGAKDAHGEGGYGAAGATGEGYGDAGHADDAAPEVSQPEASDAGTGMSAPLQGDNAALVGDLPGDDVTATSDHGLQTIADLHDAAGSTLHNVYSNPLPHVLILTAIVVGVATLSVGLAIIVRIREAYGTIEADEVRQIDFEVATAEEAGDAAGEVAA